MQIIIAVYKGKEEIQKIINGEETLDKNEVYTILEKEIIRLKIRKPQYRYLKTKNVFNITYMCDIS